jgi:hypothetical protein
VAITAHLPDFLKVRKCGSPSRGAGFALSCALLSVGPLSIQAAERFDWMPAEAGGGRLLADDLGGEQILPEITLTKTPKPTADLLKFNRVYAIHLEGFGIHNDGTHPGETSAGLNRALQDAKSAGANRIVFPKGSYLIDETLPLLIDHKDTVIDLNGATLRINSNGLPKYGVIDFIDGAENVRLTNGTLVGDRDTHDYKTEPGTHEWGAGIRFFSGRNLEVDHITSRDMTGDGVASNAHGTRSRPELLARIMHSIYAKELEPGAFDGRGGKSAGVEKMRSIKPFDLARYEGRFELGYMGGYMGYPFLKGRVFQAYFYDSEMHFLETRKCLQYRKVEVPAKARWMHLEFNQAEIPDTPAHAGASKGEWIARITNFRPPVDVHFHHNILTRNRRLGMAYCGGQRWLIEENLFSDNGGTGPAFGVDFEDGSELMQDVFFRRNKFNGNHAGDLVVCAGSELVFEENEFEAAVAMWGRPHNYVFRGNHFNGGPVSYSTRTGVASIRGNHYRNCKLSIVFDTKAVADGLNRKPGQRVATPPLRLENETLENVKAVTGTYFDFTNCNIQSSAFVVGKDTRLVRLQGGSLKESSLFFEADGPELEVQIKGVDGTPTESGPGITRKKSTP